jgi:hypothetical protein
MKKTAILTLVFSAALLAQGARGMMPMGGPGMGGPGMGPLGGRGMGMVGGTQAYVTGAPFSGVATVQMQDTLADGNTITHKYQTNVYRDGQGRIRTEESFPARGDQAARTVTTILDYVGGHRYVFDSTSTVAHEMPLRTPPANGANRPAMGAGRAGRAGANVPQAVRTTLGPQMINGVLASGQSVTTTIAAGQIGNERPIQISRVVWTSNDLKVPVLIRTSDPRFATTEMQLTNIVQAEPNPSLFAVPPGYTVQSGRGARGGQAK